MITETVPSKLSTDWNSSSEKNFDWEKAEIIAINFKQDFAGNAPAHSNPDAQSNRDECLIEDRILRIDLRLVGLGVERNDDAVRVAAEDRRREQRRHVDAAHLRPRRYRNRVPGSVHNACSCAAGWRPSSAGDRGGPVDPAARGGSGHIVG